MRRSSGTIAIPCMTIASGDWPVISAPSKLIRPERTSGGVAPATDRTVVVLPAPLRPSSAQISPSSTCIPSEWRMWLSP
jgi:hypothetical protein